MNKHLVKLTAGLRVRVTKVSESARPSVRACPMQDFLPGEENLLSLPVSYEMEGILAGGPEVGKPVVLLRYRSNGVMTIGIFRSSPVVRVDGLHFETLNSIYLVEPLPENE